MAKRTRINRPYPTHALQDVLPIAETIQEVNGGRPVRTGMLAESLGTSTKSSMLIQKLNSSAKYGLTNGAHTSEMIELTDLGEMLTAPGGPGERDEALRRAATNPDIFARFYEIYSGKRMPSDVYAANTLGRDLGLRRELTDECLHILRLNGLFAGIITDVDGIQYVGSAPSETAETPEEADDPSEAFEGHSDETQDSQDGSPPGVVVLGVAGDRRAEQVQALLTDLSITVHAIELDMSGNELVPRPALESLDAARGCVLVWPEDGGPAEEAEVHSGGAAKVWACLGAVYYRMGQRVVVVLGDGPAGAPRSELAAAGLTTLSDNGEGTGLSHMLMATLVQTQVIRVSAW